MLLIAMDRAPTGRRIDAQGFLHVDSSNISKAAVNPYRGSEIPGWRTLGLDPDRTYRMLRHPDELAKATATFNKLPLLSEHVPVDCDNIPDELIVGSTGSSAAFDGSFLTNDLVVWKRGAIDGVLSNRKRQLSCAYRYTPVMTPGNYQGLQYDGIMSQLEGNHVALVIEGRAGPDVLVGDENMKLTSRAALMVSGAVAAMVRPLLAADAKVDLTDAFKDVNAASLAMDGAPAALAARVGDLVKPHLAADKALDADALTAVIVSVPIVAQDDAIEDPKPTPPAPAPAPVPPVTPTPETPPVPNPAPTPAMDEKRVQEMVDAARAGALTEAAAIRTAEREVEPFIGEVAAMDSAAGVYKLALDHLKVDLTGVPESAYGAVLRTQPKPGTVTVAQDRNYVPTGGGKLAGIVKLAPMGVI
jgi:hypothetical protein